MEIDMETPIRFLRANGTSPYRGYEWPLPNGKPGDWVTWEGDLGCGVGGLFACKPEHAVHWIDARAFVFEPAAGTEHFEEDTKFCCRKARLVREFDTWNAQTQRLLACEFAEAVLPIFEKAHPKDTRPRECIAVSRRFAFGEATAAARAAARDAAGAAAWDAAGDAAGDAARDAAWDAARAAAGDAAGAAAWAAAWDAAGDAARDAQSHLLMRVLYDDGSWLQEQREKL